MRSVMISASRRSTMGMYGIASYVEAIEGAS
jgi:hypothetical protein